MMILICSYEALVSTYQTESCQPEDKAVCNSENFVSTYHTTGSHYKQAVRSSENLAPNRQTTPCHVQDAGSECSALVPPIRPFAVMTRDINRVSKAS
jgi:hypothetical protein